MTINYDGRHFRGLSNTENGEVGGETEFVYRQEGTRLTGRYAGGEIVRGDLLGTVGEDGSLEFCYHHLNAAGELMAGRCRSLPETDADGRLVLRESWQWLTGDRSSGESTVVEVEAANATGPADATAWAVGALESQYSAALSTLAEAIDFFPEPVWSADHPDDPAGRVVFHTLFFTDLYLNRGPHGFRDQRFHLEHPALFQDYEELEDREPKNRYDRDACIAYLAFCREKVRFALGRETAETLADDSGFRGRNLSRMALHVYNIRHVQHHAAQLGLRHQLDGGRPLHWQSR
jgi:hypothetical protein